MKTGIIYKFTIVHPDYRIKGNKIFYIGQHWHNKSVKHFLQNKLSTSYYYFGGGSIWNTYISKLKERYEGNKWRCFIKREVLFYSKTISISGLNKLERYFILNERALYSEGIGGVNLIDGASIEINPATNDYVKKKISESLKGRAKKPSHRKKLSEIFGGDKLRGKNNPNYGHRWTDEMKKKMSESKRGMYVGENNPNYGHRWTKEMKDRMSKDRKGKYTESQNPMFGRLRITNGKVNKTIMNGEKLPDGWKYGMVRKS